MTKVAQLPLLGKRLDLFDMFYKAYMDGDINLQVQALQHSSDEWKHNFFFLTPYN